MVDTPSHVQLDHIYTMLSIMHFKRAAKLAASEGPHLSADQDNRSNSGVDAYPGYVAQNHMEYKGDAQPEPIVTQLKTAARCQR